MQPRHWVLTGAIFSLFVALFMFSQAPYSFVVGGASDPFGILLLVLGLVASVTALILFGLYGSLGRKHEKDAPTGNV